MANLLDTSSRKSTFEGFPVFVDGYPFIWGLRNIIVRIRMRRFRFRDKLKCQFKEGPQNSDRNLAAILSSTTWNKYKYIAVVSGEGISGIRNKAVKLKK